MTEPLTLRPHQRKAVDELDNGKILCGDVGLGKTITSLTYYVERESPRDVYVITTAKKRDSLDWQEEAFHLQIYQNREATKHGVLTVDSWNNIDKYVDVKDAFFIFDEQRLVGNGIWVKSFLRIAERNRWILLSATPGDTWLDYIPVFLANGFYRNRTEFKTQHVIYNHHAKFPKVDRYVGAAKLVRLKNQILVDMPYDRHTTRHSVFVKTSYDEEVYRKVWKDRWHVYENRPLKDVAELFSVARKVVNSSDTRLHAVSELLRTHPRLIVFYNFDYELEILRGMLSSSSTMSSSSLETITDTSSSSPVDRLEGEAGSRTSPEPHPSQAYSSGTTDVKVCRDEWWNCEPSTPAVQIAEWNGHKHEPVPTSDRWVYLVQYTAGSEGWNCIETDAMVMFSLTYSYKQWHQAHGRIDRLNTPYEDLYYYYLMSDSTVDKAVWASLKEKKSFNEKSFARKSHIDT